MAKFLILLWFSVVFWNLENCFDYFDGGYSASDREFSSYGTKHWSKKKFEAKTAMIGKTLLWAGSQGMITGDENKFGLDVTAGTVQSCFEPPAIVGLAEVENDFVMRRLTESDVLRKWGYRYVHFESRDPRGIDVALLYRPDVFELLRCYPIPVICDNGDTLRTRDILYVEMRPVGPKRHNDNHSADKQDDEGSTWHFFVNHHPSKYGGRSSEVRRIAAMLCLKRSVDSLLEQGVTNIVAMGDFNDGPDGEAFGIVGQTLVNLGKVICNSGTAGSIRFHGHWELIDNFLVSEDVAEKMEMAILKPPFLMERDRSYPGDKPRRTYIGPRYNAGVSDHLPIMLTNR